jgi:hypothetical protein
MVYLVQQLIIRRDSDERSEATLTSLHDSDTAWAGLISAILTLWRQTGFRHHPLRNASAVIYLGAIAGLHITIPAILSIQTISERYSIEVMTRSSIPYLEQAVNL